MFDIKARYATRVAPATLSIPSKTTLLTMLEQPGTATDIDTRLLQLRNLGKKKTERRRGKQTTSMAR